MHQDTLEQGSVDTSSDATPAQPRDLVSTVTRTVLPFVLLVLTILGMARRGLEPPTNYDTFFHLRFGHEFLHGGWAPWHPGHISPLEHNDWVPTQWLSQVVMAAIEDVFGLAGIAWLTGALSVGFAVALFCSARRSTTLLGAAVLTCVAVVACLPNITMRPQMASFLFVLLTIGAWLRTRKNGRIPWYLVPAGWLWAMCHGMWPVGIAISIAACLGLTLDRRWDRATTVKAWTVPLLSLVVAALTPAGPRLIPAVLLVNSRSEYFSEWQQPDFTGIQGIALLLLFGLVVVIRIRRPFTGWFDLTLLLTALGWGVYSQRTVPVAAAMLVPLAAGALSEVLPQSHATRGERRVVLGIAGATLALLAVLVPFTASKPLVEPSWVEQELGTMSPNEPVLSEMTFGGYLMWRYPQLDLVEHGYGDVYTDAEIKARHDLGSLAPGWDDFLRSTGAEVALEPPDEPLTYALEQARWTVVHSSKDIVMLRAPADWLTSGTSATP